MLKYLFVCNTIYFHHRTHPKTYIKNNFCKNIAATFATLAAHKLFYYYEVSSTMLLAF